MVFLKEGQFLTTIGIAALPYRLNVPSACRNIVQNDKTDVKNRKVLTAD
jgi:hypothetical protein